MSNDAAERKPLSTRDWEAEKNLLYAMRASYIPDSHADYWAKDLLERYPLPPHAVVVDLACGKGTFLRTFAQALPRADRPDVTFIGIDYDAILQDGWHVWEQRLKEVDNDPRLRFQIGDIYELGDIADESVHVVTLCSFWDAIHVYTPKLKQEQRAARLFDTIARIAAPGGIVSLDEMDTHLDAMAPYLLARGFEELTDWLGPAGQTRYFQKPHE